MNSLSAKWLVAPILGLLLLGCATTPPPLRGSPDLLKFVVDGKATREEALTALGQPSGVFESERILTYRLGFEPRNNGYFVVERETRNTGWPVWKHASFSLVLVFDETGMLKRHSLVRVNE